MKGTRGLAVLTALLAGLVACADSLGPADTDQGAEQATRLAHYRQVWSATGIDDYRMTVQTHGAWFSGAAVIEVRDGVPVSVVPQTADRVAVHPAAFQGHDTVEKLFAIIQRAIEEDADHLVVSYEPGRGIPLSVSVDHAGWADDEHSFLIEDFRVLR